MTARMLVAGATGSIGRSVVELASAGGYRVRALSRRAEPAATLRATVDEVIVADASRARSIDGVCDGMDVVISALGASVNPADVERRSYYEVDRAANLNLIDEARRAGVSRFVYVSVHVAAGYAHTAYVRAHEDVVETLRSAGLSVAVVRPTGLFTAFEALLPRAARGRGLVIGNGSARTNPVHPADVAGLAMAMVTSGEADRSIGGPDILTRREIMELACEAVGKQPRVLKVPAALMRGAARAARWRSPRLGELLEFATAVSLHDCIAPSEGKRRLRDHLAEAAAFMTQGSRLKA